MTDLFFGPGPILWVQALLGPEWAPFFLVTTQLGAGLAVLLGAGLAFWLSGRRLAYSVLFVALVGTTISILLWMLLDVPRPDDPRIEIRARVSVASFPSGHVITATTVWGLLALCGLLPVAVAALVVPLAMVSRLFLGLHYLADVIAGAVIGLGVLAVYWRSWPRLSAWLGGQPPRFYTLGMISLVIGTLVVVPIATRWSHPEMWQVLGGIAGGVPAAWAEWRYVGFQPRPAAGQARAARLGIGLSGLALLFTPALVLLSEGSAGILFALFGMLGAVWVLFLAPWLFTQSGLGTAQRLEAPRPSARVDRRHRSGV